MSTTTFALLEEAWDILASHKGKGIPKYDKALDNIHQAMVQLGDFETMFPRDPGPDGLSQQKTNPPVKPKNEMELMLGVGNPNAEKLKWASQFKQLDNCLEEHLNLSWLLRQELGFEPLGTKKSWLKQLDDIYAAAGNDMACIKEGLKTAREVRNEKGLTIGSPRSTINFVGNARAKKLSGFTKFGGTVHRG